MKVLVVGSGGREHALGWKLRQDVPQAELFFANGNAGTEALGTNLPVKPTAIPELVLWAKKHRPDWVIVGPEAPLCAGLVDALLAENLSVFGPNRHASQLEESKVFTKNLLHKYQIPTARSECFDNYEKALAYSQAQLLPQVIKADGLAAGKGVVIAQTREEAAEALGQMMQQAAFGSAGTRVVIEECLQGPEVSVFAAIDGQSYALFPTAMDHKRIGEGDTGLNTGGMGAVAPNPHVTRDVEAQIRERILDPLMNAFAAEGINYQGVLFPGLMLTAQGPKVLEFNVRFGDPECEALMPLLETPLLELAEAVHTRTLDTLALKFRPLASASIVMASANYPGTPRLGDAISGLDQKLSDAAIFHAGTARKDGRVVTNGGRVLAITAWAATLEQARARAYEAVRGIHFDGMQYRKDIGTAALKLPALAAS